MNYTPRPIVATLARLRVPPIIVALSTIRIPSSESHARSRRLSPRIRNHLPDLSWKAREEEEPTTTTRTYPGLSGVIATTFSAVINLIITTVPCQARAPPGYSFSFRPFCPFRSARPESRPDVDTYVHTDFFLFLSVSRRGFCAERIRPRIPDSSSSPDNALSPLSFETRALSRRHKAHSRVPPLVITSRD